jgi:hypothetical protein
VAAPRTPDDVLLDRVVAAVGDRYDVERELGRGGMSVVYLAREVRLRRRVALKVLPPEFAYRAGVRERFLREAQTAAQLHHPHVVPVPRRRRRPGRGLAGHGLRGGARRSATGSPARAACRSPRRGASSPRWPTRSPTPTRTAWCTAT